MTIEMPTEANPVTVVEGDALEVLPKLPRDVGYATYFLVTDPPYGIALDSHSSEACMDGTKRRRKRDWKIAGDENTDATEVVLSWCAERHVAACVFGSLYRPLPGVWRNVLVWDKGDAVGGGGDPRKCWKRTAEVIYVRGNGNLREGRDGSVLRFHVGTGSDFEFHPCQKPVALMRYLIRQLTFPGDTIVDPFAGSGTTLVAALHEGRKAIGIEKDPAYCAIIRRRVKEATDDGLFAAVTRQPTLFEETA